ncbi:MAG: GIY-YIG nuclease family protein [Paracoccaceae bacterium]|nr:GIY-YIG nuclease family protein [Paracoccaceae bacterium]
MDKGSRLKLREAKTVYETDTLPRHKGEIAPQWVAAAEAKGFRVIDRVIDKNHLLVECGICGGRHAKRYSVFMADTSVLCPHCLAARQKAKAADAQLPLLRRDPDDHKHAFFLAPCGHEVRRQFGRIEKVAQEGGRVRCEICHAARESEEAEDRGWELLGPDPQGDPNYRLYRHGELGCGHEQRVARANMQSGRFTCEGCGTCWSSAPSKIYVMRFEVPGLGQVVKLGFSRDPVSRLHFQLRPTPGVTAAIRRTVDMPTGRAALIAERSMHGEIARRFPAAAVPERRLRDWIRVKSEVYVQETEPMIHALLDQLEATRAV